MYLLFIRVRACTSSDALAGELREVYAGAAGEVRIARASWSDHAMGRVAGGVSGGGGGGGRWSVVVAAVVSAGQHRLARISEAAASFGNMARRRPPVEQTRMACCVRQGALVPSCLRLELELELELAPAAGARRRPHAFHKVRRACLTPSSTRTPQRSCPAPQALRTRVRSRD